MFKFLPLLFLICFNSFALDGVFRFSYEREETIRIVDEHGKTLEKKEKRYGTGTAFYVDLSEYFPNEQNLYLTAGHNLYDSDPSVPLDKMFLEWKEDDDVVKSKVDIVYFNKKFDVAVIKTKRTPPEKPIKMATELPKIGQDIVIIGCPRGVEPTISKGKVYSYFFNDDKEVTRRALSEARVESFDHGNSGGPLLSADKSVFYGMIVAGATDAKGDIITTRALFLLNPIIQIFLEESKQLNRK